MDEEEIKLQVQEILESIPDDFDILEAQINPAVINEYIDTSEKMDFEEYNEQDLAEEGEKLFSSDVPDETKKKILILLAHSGTVKSYRIIEKYSKNIDAGLKDWCLLSLRESRMLLENYLSDEAQGFVLTGLGGRDGKLRYLFIMTSATGGSFTVFQKDMIRNEFLIVTERFNSELETIDFDKNYAMHWMWPLAMSLKKA